MDKIKLHNKTFVKSIPYDSISCEVKKIADRINRDYAGRRPLFLGVLNGSFMFVAELLKNVDLECEVAFVKLSSYSGTDSTGVVSELIGLSQTVTGRDVVVLEDIVDTGVTMKALLERLAAENPASVEIASLFVKPSRHKVAIDVKYGAFSIPDRFIVGFGLDYDGLGRNLPDVYDVED